MTPIRRTVHRTFHSLRVRNFRLYFFGQLVSVTGTWMQSIATAWLVLNLTGSGTVLGIVTALMFGPILVAGPWGGVIADRFDKRRVLVATQAAFAVLALILGGLIATGAVRLWMVYLLSLAQGIVTAVDNPTRQSFVVEMVGGDDLANAVSLNSAVMTGTRIAGPALAGLLIATVGLAWCFLVNGISYLAVIVGLLAMRAGALHRAGPVARGRGGLREGLRYVWGAPELRRPLLLMAVVFAFSFNFSVLFPLLATTTFGGGPGTLASFFSLMGIGSLLAALVHAHRSRPTRRGLALWVAGLGAFTVAASVAPITGAELALLVPLGFTGISFMIVGNSWLQLTSRPDMRGRVMALYGMVFLGTTPIGAPIAGWVAEHVGVRFAMASGGLIAVAAGGIALLALRRESSGASAAPAPGPTFEEKELEPAFRQSLGA